uniref:Uncharacterized protein n=1 Tax=Heterorhabditis bacteriophora TaxID=37862 RepID=A0A1I7WI14_HETBA
MYLLICIYLFKKKYVMSSSATKIILTLIVHTDFLPSGRI